MRICSLRLCEINIDNESLGDITDTQSRHANRKSYITGDPKSRNRGIAERRNNGKSPQILKHGIMENDLNLKTRNRGK